MAASGGTLQAVVSGVPRWRGLAIASLLVATLGAAGFAAGRATAPQTGTSIRQASVESLPVFIRPGKHRGQARFGPGSAELVYQIRPGTHGGGQVKGD
ncbi:MAG TPA: hypothetical protein VFA08_11050 [Actinomycetota bacterium]|jgi:hypothetical protein|nr:hypothetical protein [Actinomycetota bacterium]